MKKKKNNHASNPNQINGETMQTQKDIILQKETKKRS